MQLGFDFQTPPGFSHHPEWLSRAEEQALLELLRAFDYEPYVMRGQASKREVRFFGADYGQNRTRTEQPPIPAQILALRDRLAPLLHRPASDFVQVLINHYPIGAGIGWHRDFATFGPEIVGVSLLGACRLQLRATMTSPIHTCALGPRDAYILAGPARATWLHGIPPVKEERFSITFRTVRGRS